MHIPFGRPAAWAPVRGGEGYPRLGGMVHFYTVEDKTLVSADIFGLPESQTGFFAFHIHEGGSCAEPGSHYNPGKAPHPGHTGDLPPLLSAGGRAYLAVLTDRFRPEEIVGRTVVIHANAEDFRTQPAGDPGPRIACGVVRKNRFF